MSGFPRVCSSFCLIDAHDSLRMITAMEKLGESHGLQPSRHEHGTRRWRSVYSVNRVRKTIICGNSAWHVKCLRVIWASFALYMYYCCVVHFHSNFTLLVFIAITYRLNLAYSLDLSDLFQLRQKSTEGRWTFQDYGPYQMKMKMKIR